MNQLPVADHHQAKKLLSLIQSCVHCSYEVVTASGLSSPSR